ncbi:hypothetical protein G6N82_02445 [Altererythrobacter sp. BO-6]|uniref:hypothetical protein n=1 Tax=Altererythrobacter sp. BO-6 TaxID=2604537 RepID=UPI0013E1A869|nr:hypothetical protein [Altererythrobacter sp. BO-6]QIG53162.1 hypothetical protein G6N82_02445 [Altererythrobacter sp. BO-6]
MTYMPRLVAFAAASGAALLTTPATAQDSNGDSYIQFSTGVDYSSGDYGDAEDTDMLAVPVSVKYQAGDFYVRASTAWVDVKGPSGIIPGDGGVNPGRGNGGGGTPPPTEIVSRSGLADVNLEAGYSLFLGGSTFFDAVGKVKLPTASETKFLGTGSTDFTAQGELLHVMDNVSFSLVGGRRFNGSSDLYELQDVWLAGAGVYVAADDVTLGLDYEWREGAVEGSPDRSELTGSLTYKLNESLRLQGYGYTGLADGSPDIGGGLQVLLRLGQ